MSAIGGEVEIGIESRDFRFWPITEVGPGNGVLVEAKIGKLEINKPPWSEHELSSA